MKKSIGDLLFQIIPVMVGVYLGFVVSNWSEDNQKNKQAKVLLKNLHAEIEENEKIVHGVIAYHGMLRDSSNHYAEMGDEIKIPTFFQGTRLLKLNNSAYQTGIQTGIINELSLDKIQALNQLYVFQDTYNEYGNIIMSNFLSKDFSDKKEDIREIARFLSITMTDISTMEEGLIEVFETTKNTLKQ